MTHPKVHLTYAETAKPALGAIKENVPAATIRRNGKNRIDRVSRLALSKSPVLNSKLIVDALPQEHLTVCSTP